MAGSKPLSPDEIDRVLASLATEEERCLFVLGLYTGFRISELLSLTLHDVLEDTSGHQCRHQCGIIRDTITVMRRNMKGKTSSRSVVLHDRVRMALNGYVLTKMGQISTRSDNKWVKLFALNRFQAHRRITRACRLAGVTGRVSSHSMRKTFAKRVYDALDHDLIGTQRALGHASINSTVKYLEFDQERIDAAILGKGK